MSETHTQTEARAGKVSRTKTFKIGEYCAGGLIKIKSCGENIKIEIRDDFNDTLYYVGAFGRIHERQIFEFLTRSTTPYFADKVIQWIKVKVWGLA